jgi:hypothetical protein
VNPNREGERADPGPRADARGSVGFASRHDLNMPLMR